MSTPPTQVNIVNAPQGQPGRPNPYLPGGQGNSQQPIPFVAIHPEGYKFYQQAIDSKILYLEELSILLYDAQLARSDVIDPESPIPGYKLVKRADKWTPAIRYEGFKQFLGIVLFTTNTAISLSKTDESFDPEKFAEDETMAVMRMLVAKRHEWKFSNFALIRPLGMALWQNIFHIEMRSHSRKGRQTLMDKVFHPNILLGGNGEQPRQENTLRRWSPW